MTKPTNELLRRITPVSHYVEIRLPGKLKRNQIDSCLGLINEGLRSSETTNLLLIFDDSVGPLQSPSKSGFMDGGVGKLAIVGDFGSEEELATLRKHLSPEAVDFFEPDEVGEARGWLECPS